MLNLYEILQVHPTASLDIIKAAAKTLSAKYHPDNRRTGNADKFREVREAHDILINPEKRADFDRQFFGKQAQQAQQQNSPSGHMENRWVNGIGFTPVFIPDLPQPYPEPYPNAFVSMGQDMLTEMAHSMVERTIQELFDRMRRGR